MADRPLSEFGALPPLRPHQAAVVDRVVRSTGPLRLLLDFPVGTGKSAALLAAVDAVLTSAPEATALLVAPYRVILEQWAFRLRGLARYQVVMLDSAEHRRLQLVTPVDAALFSGPGAYLVTTQALRRSELLRDVLSAAWEIVVIDEAVLDGEGITATALRDIWRSSRVRVAVGAFDGTQRIDVMTPETFIPSRSIDVVTYTPSEDESTIQRKVEDIAQRLASVDASAATDLRASIRRSLFSLGQWIAAAFQPTEAEGAPALALAVEDLERLESAIEGLAVDTRLDAVVDAVRGAHGRDDVGTIVVFCGDIDTAYYIESRLEVQSEIGGEWFRGSLFLLSEATAAQERAEIIQAIAELPSAVLIVTDAALDEFGLGAVSRAIHYNLPDTPEALLRRIASADGPGGERRVTHAVLAEAGHAGEVRWLFDAAAILGRLPTEMMVLRVDPT